MKFRSALPILYFGFLFAQDPVLLKFFASEDDFISGKTIESTERHRRPYLEIAYNDQGRPVMKSKIDESGRILEQEIYSYARDGSLLRRAVLNEDQEVVLLIRYGKDEPWSREFRAFIIPDQTRLSYSGQQSKFDLNSGGQVEKVQFQTVDQQMYGSIKFRYDHLGFLSEEIWRTLPDQELVRRFVYDYNLMTETSEIWEYASGGELISHMTLAQAPADQLYLSPPPRTGNILDEIDLILDDLKARGITAPISAFIPKMVWDRIRLNNGEEYMTDVVEISKGTVLFRLPEQDDLLQFPLSRVQSIVSRSGEFLYP